MERLIRTALTLIGFGMNIAEVVSAMVDEGHSQEDSFLAACAASILAKDR